MYLRSLVAVVDASRLELWQFLCDFVQGVLTLWLGSVAIVAAQRENPSEGTSYSDVFMGFGITWCIVGLLLTSTSVGLCFCPMRRGDFPWEALSGRADAPAEAPAAPETDGYTNLPS